MTAVPQNTILIATGNAGKVRELSEMLNVLPFDVKGLSEVANLADVAETGTTFTENAELKAAGYARQAGLWSLADDSGLEVAALGGAPGVHSARYGGADTPYSEKMQLLLDEISASGTSERNARFVCAAVVADEAGRIMFRAEGECRGKIAAQPRGSGGFGYDPLFIPDGYDLTFAELPEQVKAEISHRARAISKIIRYLLGFTGTLT